MHFSAEILTHLTTSCCLDSTGGVRNRRNTRLSISPASTAHPDPSTAQEANLPQTPGTQFSFLCKLCISKAKICSLFSGKRIILKSKPEVKTARYTARQDWKYDHTSEKKTDLCKIDLFLDGF